MAHPEVLISRATLEQRELVQRMLELYQHDLSDIWDQDLDEHGVFGYELDRYWNSAECTPYLFWVAHKPAGFALVDGQVKLPGGDTWMDQFFVMKKCRGRGVGAAARGEPR